MTWPITHEQARAFWDADTPKEECERVRHEMLDREPVVWLDNLSELVGHEWWKGYLAGTVLVDTWPILWDRDELAAALVFEDFAEAMEYGWPGASAALLTAENLALLLQSERQETRTLAISLAGRAH